jgi:hypothetical protein
MGSRARKGHISRAVNGIKDKKHQQEVIQKVQ